jgi:hypothetical protein
MNLIRIKNTTTKPHKMLNEVKIFFENVSHFRQLLNEGVSESTIEAAIHKHKIVHIYYAGDDTILKGYRTIKPVALGDSISKKAKEEGGYKLLRAWETAGNSDSKKKYADKKGRYQYGWRLFRVDKITSFLPSGRVFSVEEGKFPEGYNPDDSQMTNITAAVEVTTNVPKTQVKAGTIQQKIPEPDSAFKGQKEKFQYFSKMGKKQREITADEVKDLWDWALKYRSKVSREKLIVITDEHGDMILKNIDQKGQIPQESIVGNLKDLYVRLVKPSANVDKSFFNKIKNDITQKMNQDNIAKENKENKNFFK